MVVGAGTVLSPAQAAEARDAGAKSFPAEPMGGIAFLSRDDEQAPEFATAASALTPPPAVGWSTGASPGATSDAIQTRIGGKLRSIVVQ
jgi:hypothetical protein